MATVNIYKKVDYKNKGTLCKIEIKIFLRRETSSFIEAPCAASFVIIWNTKNITLRNEWVDEILKRTLACSTRCS